MMQNRYWMLSDQNQVKTPSRFRIMAERFRAEIRVYRGVMTDPRCPRAARWLLGLAVAYAVSPVDIIPDFIPVIGHLDDMLIVPFLLWLAMRMIPRKLVEEHRGKLQAVDCREKRERTPNTDQPIAISDTQTPKVLSKVL